MGSVPSTLVEPQITIDKIIGVDPLSPAQLEALSNLDNFSFDDGSIQNLSMKASYLTINYSAMLKKSASTPEEMRKLVTRASVSNSQRKISGKICLRNPFEVRWRGRGPPLWGMRRFAVHSKCETTTCHFHASRFALTRIYLSTGELLRDANDRRSCRNSRHPLEPNQVGSKNSRNS